MSKEYQKLYYARNQEKLRKRHREWKREYHRKVRAGLIIPKPVEEYPEWQSGECAICHDTIAGHIYHLVFRGQRVSLDRGCFEWYSDGRFNKKRENGVIRGVDNS